MILVLCASPKALLEAAHDKAHELAFPSKSGVSSHRARYLSSSHVTEDIDTGERWHFVSTDSPENAQFLCGQIYTDYEGELPFEWRETVLSRVRRVRSL
jgi:hypothetical protein